MDPTAGSDDGELLLPSSSIGRASARRLKDNRSKAGTWEPCLVARDGPELAAETGEDRSKGRRLA